MDNPGENNVQPVPSASKRHPGFFSHPQLLCNAADVRRSGLDLHKGAVGFVLANANESLHLQGPQQLHGLVEIHAQASL